MSNTKLDILFKTVTLLHREEQLETPHEERTFDLARLVVETMSTNSKANQLVGGDSSVIAALKNLVLDMCSSPSGYDADSLMQSLQLILKDKQSLIPPIEKAITAELTVPGLKRSIITMRRRLYAYHKETELRSLISKASYAINSGGIGKRSLMDFASELATQIETVACTGSGEVDPGIVNEFDLDSETELAELFTKVSGENREDALLKTTWEPLNDMFNKGFRRGGMLMYNALQHNYKSGMARTLMAQMVVANKPVMTDIDKKPLMVYISLEDDSDVSIEFFYNYLYYSEYGKLPDMSTVTPEEAAKYIKTKTSVNGYNIKLLRINPSEWTYKHLFNKTMEYEADGYEVHAVFMDYLAKLPTTGCIHGPTGSDIRDLFNRVRNFYSSRGTFFCTPHQLSGDAKQLIRNGVDPATFVKEVAGRGYTDSCKSLDHIVDYSFCMHKAKINGAPHMTFAWEKDRRPAIVDDSKKYFTARFPKGAPIPETLLEEQASTTGDDLDDLML